MRGIDLDAVAGSGPNGRVTEADLDRVVDEPAALPAAAESVTASVAATGSASATVVAGAGVVEVDVTDLAAELAHDRSGLLAAVAAATLSALRRAGHPVTDVAVARPDGEWLIAGAHDLTVAALRARLAGGDGGAGGPAPVRIVDAADLALRIVAPRAGELAALAVGAVVERVVVDRAGGHFAFAARRTVSISLSSTVLADGTVDGALAELRRQLAGA